MTAVPAGSSCSPSSSRWLPLVLPPFFLQLLTEIAIVGLFATAFNLLMGFGGMVSFGHAAYFALGAYAAALLVKQAGVPDAARAAGGADRGGGGRAALRLLHRAPHATRTSPCSRWPSPRSSSPSIFKWKALTGGDDGLLDVWPPPRCSSRRSPTTTSRSRWSGWRCSPCTPSSTRRSATRSGRCARTRAAPASSASNVRRHQLVAFVISGAFSGLAGGLFAFYNGSVFPDFAYFTKSFEPLVVALLGGVQSFFGPLAGAVRLQDPRVAHQPPVAGVLAALPRRAS